MDQTTRLGCIFYFAMYPYKVQTEILPSSREWKLILSHSQSVTVTSSRLSPSRETRDFGWLQRWRQGEWCDGSCDVHDAKTSLFISLRVYLPMQLILARSISSKIRFYYYILSYTRDEKWHRECLGLTVWGGHSQNMRGHNELEMTN